jgi:hypothetical protein
VDPETCEAIEQLGRDLRGEIQSSAGETRADVDERVRESEARMRRHFDVVAESLRGEIQSSVAATQAHVDEPVRESEARMRRHVDVVAESLRGDIRAMAEAVAMSGEQRDRRLGEHTERTDGLEGRVLRLEVRVSTLEDGRKPRRRR